jgi:hypothetical protein
VSDPRPSDMLGRVTGAEASIEGLLRREKERDERIAEIDQRIRQTHSTSMSDREIDAKLEAVEARTDTKFAQFIGRLDAMNVKIDLLTDAVGGTRTLILGVLMPTIIVGFIAIFFGLFAILQWSDARLFGAIQMREMMRPAGTDPAAKAPEQPKPPQEQAKPK